MFTASFRTFPSKSAVLTINVVGSSPWLILARLVSRPSDYNRTSASKATNRRSSGVSLFR